MARMHNLSPQMRRQMREYLAASSHLAAQAAHSFVTQKFTPTLRGEVSWSCHRRWITSIWFLRDAERACLVGLATVLVPAVYSSGEMTHDDESLFVLQHGTAVLRGRILKPGKVWGDDLILSNPELRISCSHVCALSAYMEVQQLGRIPLLELLQRFPHTEQRVRKHAIWLALRRAFVAASQQRKLRAEADAFVHNASYNRIASSDLRRHLSRRDRDPHHGSGKLHYSTSPSRSKGSRLVVFAGATRRATIFEMPSERVLVRLVACVLRVRAPSRVARRRVERVMAMVMQRIAAMAAAAVL